MTLVKFKQRPVNGDFNNLMDDFFAPFSSILGNDVATSTRPPFVPVNITEAEGGYTLEVVAPGLEKEDFKISLDKNLLTIAAEKKEEGEFTGKSIRKEYKFQSFNRSFTIDEKIDGEAISAKYVNGVLTLNLPRKAEVKEATKQINIQ
ncbi:MAG TPA: Hsp20/alpha crystallin family protein [Chitinophagaceae bacterium]